MYFKADAYIFCLIFIALFFCIDVNAQEPTEQQKIFLDSIKRKSEFFIPGRQSPEGQSGVAVIATPQKATTGWSV